MYLSRKEDSQRILRTLLDEWDLRLSVTCSQEKGKEKEKEKEKELARRRKKWRFIGSVEFITIKMIFRESVSEASNIIWIGLFNVEDCACAQTSSSNEIGVRNSPDQDYPCKKRKDRRGTSVHWKANKLVDLLLNTMPGLTNVQYFPSTGCTRSSRYKVCLIDKHRIVMCKSRDWETEGIGAIRQLSRPVDKKNYAKIIVYWNWLTW